PPVGHPRPQSPRRFAVTEQFLERRYVQGLQPLALGQAPILEATLQEVASVEGDGALEGSGVRRFDLFSAGCSNRGEGLLELGHVQPDVLAVDLEPLWPCMQEGTLAVAATFQSPDLPQALPKVLSRLCGRAVRPQCPRDDLPMMRTISRQQQVSEKLLQLSAFQGADDDQPSPCL